MNLGNKTSRIALSVMAAITALNLVLALNFVGAATSTLKMTTRVDLFSL